MSDSPSVAAAPAPVARVRARFGLAAILFATFACAACGLVYELALIALGGYLVGNTIHQTSIVLGVFVFSMGLGALGAKRLVGSPLLGFAAIEAALGLIGGTSVLLLYAAFAWLGLYQPFVVLTSLVVGGLIGAEIPVLVTILERLSKRGMPHAVADLFAVDYLGALAGGLAFPFVLLPMFGLLRGTLLTGAINVVCAAVVLVPLGRELTTRRRAAAGLSLVGVFGALALVATQAADFELSARQALYDDPIVHAERTPYQEIVLTRSIGRRDLRLFLNGDLQFSSVDEYRYHEALVHPAMARDPRSVLVLGGGDGLAVREVLRYTGVEEVVLVELDARVTRLASQHRAVRSLNRSALTDRRVRVVHADAFSWVRDASDGFDAVIADFPDPEDVATAKLYSQEMYTLIGRLVRPDGVVAVQAGSPHFAGDAFWCIERTLAAAGWETVPYQVDVPSFGNWGFVLAARQPPRLELSESAPPLRSLDQASLDAASVFPPDRAARPVEVSTLLRPVVLDYERGAWRDY